MAAIKEINPLPADRNIFLSNYANNEAFVKFLGSKLELMDFDIIQGPSDADNPIAMMMIQQLDISFLADFEQKKTKNALFLPYKAR